MPKTHGKELAEDRFSFTNFVKDKIIFQDKTFICKEGNQVFKYIIKPDMAYDSYIIQYNIVEKIGVAKNYVENFKTLEEELNLLP